MRPPPVTSRLHMHGWILLCAVLSAGCNTLQGNVNNQNGMSQYHAGNFTAAREEFQRAAADEPWNPDYLHNLASAMKREGDLEGAEKNYRRAIEIDRSHQPSYHGLAQLMREEGRQGEARQLLEGWLGSQPYTSDPYIEMAWLEREEGNLARSEHYLVQALRVRPNDHVATTQLAYLYDQTNQTARAEAMYRRSLYTRWYQPEVQARVTQMQQQRVYGGYGPTAPAYALNATPYLAGGEVGPQAISSPPPVLPGQPLGGFGGSPVASRAPLGVPVYSAQSLAAEPLGGDPAHASQISSEPPLVEPR